MANLKSCLNFNFKILTKPCAQSLKKSLAFLPNLSFEICNKLLQTQSSLATVTTSTSFVLASPHARVTDKGKQWSDSGPIKKNNISPQASWGGKGVAAKVGWAAVVHSSYSLPLNKSKIRNDMDRETLKKSLDSTPEAKSFLLQGSYPTAVRLRDCW